MLKYVDLRYIIFSVSILFLPCFNVTLKRAKSLEWIDVFSQYEMEWGKDIVMLAETIDETERRASERGKSERLSTSHEISN